MKNNTKETRGSELVAISGLWRRSSYLGSDAVVPVFGAVRRGEKADTVLLSAVGEALSRWSQCLHKEAVMKASSRNASLK